MQRLEEVTERDLQQYERWQPRLEQWEQDNKEWNEERLPWIMEKVVLNIVKGTGIGGFSGCLFGLCLALFICLILWLYSGIRWGIHCVLRMLIPGVRRMERLHATILRKRIQRFDGR